MTNRPKVGLAVFVSSARHPNCVLLGRRKNSCGSGSFAVPGGHLEFGESFEECARREVMEEAGIKLNDVRLERVVNIVWPEENYHYVDIVMRGEVDLNYKEEPENMEPDKCTGWEWYNWDALPPVAEQFRPLQVIIEDGYTPFRRP